MLVEGGGLRDPVAAQVEGAVLSLLRPADQFTIELIARLRAETVEWLRAEIEEWLRAEIEEQTHIHVRART